MPGQYVDDPEPVQLTTPESETAVSALEELVYGELPTLPTVNLPKVDLPGPTKLENSLIGSGGDIIKNLVANIGKMPEAYKMGMGEMKKTLAGGYDPEKSTFYKGLREASQREEEKGVGDIRRRGQLGGMLYSEPNMRTEGEYRAKMGTGRSIMLGELFEKERDRGSALVPQLLGYAGFEEKQPYNVLQGMQGFSGLAGLPRNIKTQQAMINQQTGVQEALSNQQTGIQQAMLPYTAQAPILSGLADYGNFYTPTQTYQPGPLDYILGGVGSIAGK